MQEMNMVSKPVRQGFVGVSRSAYNPYILLQTDDGQQSRIVLTVEETKDLIEKLEEMISKVEMYPHGLKDCNDLNEIG
jgi:hypothetical protein